MSDDNLTVARLVLGGFSRDEAIKLAAKLDADPAGTPIDPLAARVAAAGGTPAADALTASNEAEAPAPSDAERFLNLTAKEWAALDRDEYTRGIRIVTAARSGR
jgi:hypothetical protein